MERKLPSSICFSLLKIKFKTIKLNNNEELSFQLNIRSLRIFFRVLLLTFLLLIPYKKIFSQIASEKRGGVCFRVDDTQQKQRWWEYKAVFDKYGYKFGMSQCLDANLSDTAYLNLIRTFASEGHEFMDHTPSHTVTYLTVLKTSDTVAYSGNPNVHHINNKKVCLKYDENFVSSPSSGKIRIIGNSLAISYNNGEFGNMYGNPYYYAIYIPAFNGVYLYTNLQNKNPADPDSLTLKSFWDETITLPVMDSLVFHKISQYAIRIPFGSRKLLAERTVNLCNEYNLPVPTTFIHPGGSLPMLYKSDVKEVWGNIANYTSGASYNEGSIKCYNEYDPLKEKRYGIMWGDFIEENWTLPAIKAKIANNIALHYVVYGQSHFTNLTGGWSGYIARMDTLLSWLQNCNIPVKTYREWTSYLFDSIPNPFVNIFPSIGVDLDSNNIPDGFLNATFLDNSDGVVSSGNKCFSRSSTGIICEVQNLAGLEKGNNVFGLYTKGSTGDSVLVKITFSEISLVLNYKVPANTSNWNYYFFNFNIPVNVNKANFQISVSNYVSGVVKVSGMNLRKISQTFIEKNKSFIAPAHQSFQNIDLKNFIVDSVYSKSNIQLQLKTDNSNKLQYFTDTNKILSVVKPSIFWKGTDSLKIVISNPDKTTDSTYFYFISKDPEICKYDSILLDVSGNYVNVTWSSQPTDNSLKQGNYNWQKVRPLQNTQYTVRCINSSNDTTWQQVYVVVNDIPIADAGIDRTVCFMDSIILNATGGVEYIWNKNVIQGQPFSVTDSGFYTVNVINQKGCSAKDSLYINVIPKPYASSIFGDTNICCNSQANLSISNYSGNITWQRKINSVWVDIQGATSQNYQTPLLQQNTYFRVKASRSFCTDSFSDSVLVSVKPLPVGGIISVDSTVCYSSSVHLVLSGHKGQIQWQQSPNGINNWQVISNSASYDSVLILNNITNKTFFRARLGDSLCSTVYSSIDSVVITPMPVAGTLVVASPVCYNSSSQLTLNNYQGDILWQMKPITSSNWVDLPSTQTGNTYTSPLITSNTLFRAKVFNSYCPAVYSNIDTVFIDLMPNAGSISGVNNICQGSNVKLKVSSYFPTIAWQESTDSIVWQNANGIVSNDTLTDYPTQTKWYRTKAVNGSCQPQFSAAFKVKVDSLSMGGEAIANSPICSGDSTTITLYNFRGNTIQWQMSWNWGSTWSNVSNSYIGVNSPLLKTLALTSGNLYRASVKNGICPVAYSIADTITVNNMTQAGNINVLSPICAGNTTKCYLYSYTGAIQWQESSDTINWYNVSSGSGMNSSPYTTPVLTTTTYYRAKVKSGVCPEKFSAYDTAWVNTLIVPYIDIEMIGGSNPQCAPADTVVFKANFYNGGNNPVLQWKKGWSNVGTNDSILRILPQNNDQIKCQLTSNAVCATPSSVTSNIITMVVNSKPTVIFNLPANIDTLCSNMSYVTITGASPANGVFSGVGVTGNIFNPSQAGVGIHPITYTYTVPSTGCSDSVTRNITVVDCTNVFDYKNDKIAVYPNPFDKSLQIFLSDDLMDGTVSLENIVGEVVLLQKLHCNSLTLNTENLNAGIYFLKIFSKSNYAVVKLIKR